MALTTYERIKGALAGVGNAGDRILKHTNELRPFAEYITDGPKLQMFTILLQAIDDQAEQLKTVSDDD